MAKAKKPTRSIARLAGNGLREAEFHFKEADKRQLLAVLTDKLGVSPKDKSVRTFIQAVEMAIAGFKAYQELEKEKPAGRRIRATLNQLKQDASNLRKGLKGMDSDTRFHLELSLQAPMFRVHDPAVANKKPPGKGTLSMIKSVRALRIAAQEFIDHLTLDLDTLEIVSTLAQSAPRQTKGGRPKEHWRLELATEIAHAFVECLKIDPTTPQKGQFVEEGPFTSVLRICLNGAGINVKDPHRLALEAVRQVNVEKPGQG